LDRIESLGLADEKILGQLRQQVANAKGPVSAETLAKVLVDKGHLTVFQAKKIVGEVTAAREEAKSKAAKVPPKPQKPADDDLGLADDSDGLELLEESPPPAPAKPAKPAKPTAPAKKPQPKPADDLELLDDDDGLQPLEDDGLELIDEGGDDLQPIDEDDGLELIEEAPQKPVAPKPSPAKQQPQKPAQPKQSAPGKPQQSTAKQTPAKTEPKKTASQSPAKAPAKTSAPAKQAAAKASAPAPVVSDLEPLDDGLEPLGEGDLLDAGGLTSLDDGLAPLDSGLDPLSDPLVAKAAAPKSAVAAPVPKGGKKNQWDSALIWVGGGGLLVLILLGGLLYFTIARGNANEAFQLAETDFNSGAYAQAIPKYESFLSKYSKDANASLARVRIGVSQIRLAVSGASDWSAALATTEETLNKIQNEDRFDDARAALADILPTIAEALAQQAKKSQDQSDKAAKFVADAEHALELVNNGAYIPPSLRQPIEPKVNKTLEEIAGVKREINQDKELKSALAAMQTATSAGKTGEASDIRRSLLKKYPGLEPNEDVKKATLAISTKEMGLAKVNEETLAPAAMEAAVATPIALVDRTGDAASGASGNAIFNVSGSVYGVDAASGKVAWRRYIGMESTGVPALLSGSPADLAIIDRRTHDLLRIKASDGSIAWRLPIGEPCSNPTVVNDKLFVSTNSGKILEVDAASGQSTRRAVLPQGTTQSAGYDPRRPQLYQLGEHNTLFVISSTSLECKEVLFFGHVAGSIAAPPVATGGQVFLCHNAGPDYSVIHVFSADAEGLNLVKKRDPVRMKGHIVTPPVVDGKRVYVFSDLGEARVFDVDPANVNEPVTELARLVGTRKEPVVPYALVIDGKAWVGDERLTMYELQPAKKELTRRWSLFAGDAFLAPPHKSGDTVVAARLRKNVGDVAIGAVGALDGSLQWKTSVAVPVKAIAASGGKMFAVNASGSAFALSESAPVIEAAARLSATADPPHFHLAWPAEGKIIAAPRSGAPQWAVVDLAAPKATLVKHAAEGITLTGQAIGFEGGVLLPLSNGQIVLADAATGQPLVLPFQPKLDAGEAPAWSTPIVVQGAKATFAIANARGQLFTAARKEQPRPHLALAKQADAGVMPGSSLAQLEDKILAVVEKEGQYTLTPFALADLAPGEPLALDSGVAFGPRTVGDVVLVATDGEGLHCIESGLKVRWKLPLGGAGIAGLATRGEELIAVTTRGEILRIDAAGKAVKKLATASPLAGDPVIEGDKLWCPGVDGAVYVVPLSALEG
jgi:outer membrane protein assembly factor BamB/outer membrane biosynthesis protein TonB